MNRRLKYILFLLLLIPLNVFSLSSDYNDKLKDIVSSKQDDNIINIYFFRGEGCPHCKEEEEFFKDIKEEYKDKIKIYDYETWHNEENDELMIKAKKEFGITKTGVPFTVIGDHYHLGYTNYIGKDIKHEIDYYLDSTNNVINNKDNSNENKEIKKEDIDNYKTLPLFGRVNVKKVSLPLVAIILGFIDGFNPCAMWVLLFLISFLLNTKSKKKRWLIGTVFLFISGLIYFLSMLGMNVILSMVLVNLIRNIIALFIFVLGIISLINFIKTRNEEVGCKVVTGKRRKIISNLINKIVNNDIILLSLFLVAVLAVLVNLVELACSLGFPLVFSEIISINKIAGVERISYLLLYIIFYMLDDIIVFTISMITLERTGLTNKYNKVCNLISSIIMILLGILLIFKPEWVMLNF